MIIKGQQNQNLKFIKSLVFIELVSQDIWIMQILIWWKNVFLKKEKLQKSTLVLEGFRKKKFPGHKTSIKIYKKCKSFYKIKEVPTTVIYFDEVRRGKSKEKVGVFKWKNF